jgi:hypothetical protein
MSERRIPNGCLIETRPTYADLSPCSVCPRRFSEAHGQGPGIERSGRVAYPPALEGVASSQVVTHGGEIGVTQVVIQPSYGRPASRRRWRDTLGKPVPFGEPGYLRLLTEEQQARLLAMHPAGRVRFWGATSTHDKNMERLVTGDVVLFTGLRHLRAVGEVGYSFRNKPFADRLWAPDPDSGGWSNVYSLLTFELVSIPYDEVWKLPGFKEGDNFVGLRFLDEQKGRDLLDGLRIETRTSAEQDALGEQAVIDAISAETQIIESEAVHTSETSYERNPGSIIVHRAEALLVAEYEEALTGLSVKRIRTPAGVTDLYVTGPDGPEVIEAKSGSDRRFVRQALGQLLDYAPHTPAPASRLGALFPKRPAEADIALLHRYGIDCIYRTEPKVFARREAPAEARTHMQKLWHG